MSALVQPISDAESLALLRRRMIREVEVSSKAASPAPVMPSAGG